MTEIPQSRKPVPIGTRSQLFVDGYLIDVRDGLTENLHSLTKEPEPVLTPDAPWEYPGQGGVGGPVNVHYDAEEGVFKMWYVARQLFTVGVLTGRPTYVCYATSRDGLVWERPEVGLVEFDGSTANNIVSSDRFVMEHGMLDNAEMRAVEPPEFRYKSMRWLGRDADGIASYGASFSTDGLRWRAHPDNPLMRSRRFNDSGSTAVLRHSYLQDDPPGFPSPKYAFFSRLDVEVGAWKQRRCVGVSTSEGSRPPFLDWTEPVLVLAPDKLDDDLAEERLAADRPYLLHDHPDDHRSEFYTLLVHRSGDVLLGFLWVFEPAFEVSRLGAGNQHGPVHVQLVASRDLIHWHRVGDRQPILAHGEPGSFDAAMIFYHSFPMSVGDEWWFYYCGADTFHTQWPYLDDAVRIPHLEDVRAGRRQLPAIGLAKIRRDGFVSLDAGPDEGTLITRPIQPGGQRLELNARAAAGGAIRVEVQDASGATLPGYASTDCSPIGGDSIALPVSWGARSGDAAWPERALRLKFELTNAQLYGFRFH